MTAAIRLEETTIAEQLAQVAAARAERETAPLCTTIGCVRQALDKYERSAIERAQRRLTRTMLLAIGDSGELTGPVPEEHESGEACELRAALSALLLTPSPVATPAEQPANDSCVVPVSGATIVHTARTWGESPVILRLPEGEEFRGAPTEPSPPPSSRAAPASTRQATPQDVQHVAALAAEMSVLEQQWQAQPKQRMGQQIRAIAAEMRQLLGVFPHGHNLRWELESLPSRLHVLVRDSDVDGFVNGIARNSTGDWPILAQRHRREMFAFDQRAKNPKPKNLHVHAPKGLATIGDAIGHALRVAPAPAVDTCRWPKLRAALGGKKLMLVGGSTTQPEKVRATRERTGIDMEWEAIAKDAPRRGESIVRRIASGGVPACLVAEAFMSHQQYYRIEAAFRTAGVPFAFCDRVGTASVEQAFDSLEAKLGAK